MKRILVLGGTSFIGRHFTQALLSSREYRITLFNRGQTNPGLFTDVHYIQGDRSKPQDLKQLSTKKWDYVVDFSTYFPEQLKLTLDNIHIQNTGLYIFISTCSVYQADSPNLILRNEEAALKSTQNVDLHKDVTETYGERKVACERILRKSGLPALIFRPALVYGSYDPTDRLYYWLYHIKQGGLLMIPDQGQRFFSVTYVHDLVATLMHSLEKKPGQNLYNVVSTPMLNIRKIIDAVSPILNRHSMILNAPPAFLHMEGVKQWTDMPLWIDGDHCTFNANRWQQDFKITPTNFEKGLLETLGYYTEIGWPVPKSGMSPKRRENLLNKLRQSML